MGKTGREPLACEIFRVTMVAGKSYLTIPDQSEPCGEKDFLIPDKVLAHNIKDAANAWASASIKQAVNAKLEEAAKSVDLSAFSVKGAIQIIRALKESHK